MDTLPFGVRAVGLFVGYCTGRANGLGGVAFMGKMLDAMAASCAGELRTARSMLVNYPKRKYFEEQFHLRNGAPCKKRKAGQRLALGTVQSTIGRDQTVRFLL